jgi:hypothetical protein
MDHVNSLLVLPVSDDVNTVWAVALSFADSCAAIYSCSGLTDYFNGYPEPGRAERFRSWDTSFFYRRVSETRGFST